MARSRAPRPHARRAATPKPKLTHGKRAREAGCAARQPTSLRGWIGAAGHEHRDGATSFSRAPSVGERGFGRKRHGAEQRPGVRFSRRRATAHNIAARARRRKRRAGPSVGRIGARQGGPPVDMGATEAGTPPGFDPPPRGIRSVRMEGGGVPEPDGGRGGSAV